MANVTKSDKLIGRLGELSPEISQKKQPGRPAIGRGVQVNIVMRPELVDKLDIYAKSRGENRSQAIRRILKLVL